MDINNIFDIDLYRELNNDLKHFNNNQLLDHYHNHGKYENRIYSYNQFYEIYPNFNIEIYKNFNYDLTHFNNDQLLCHYHNHGKYENRIFSINSFYSVYLNFNDKIFKTFQANYNECSEIEMIYNFYFAKLINCFDIILILMIFF